MKRAIGAPRADTKPDLTLDVVLFLGLVLTLGNTDRVERPSAAVQALDSSVAFLAHTACPVAPLVQSRAIVTFVIRSHLLTQQSFARTLGAYEHWALAAIVAPEHRGRASLACVFCIDWCRDPHLVVVTERAWA